MEYSKKGYEKLLRRMTNDKIFEEWVNVTRELRIKHGEVLKDIPITCVDKRYM